jgi:hypothetical protein
MLICRFWADDLPASFAEMIDPPMPAMPTTPVMAPEMTLA